MLKISEKEKRKEEWGARKNLSGFFDLLLTVDRRVNPHLYKNLSNEKI